METKTNAGIGADAANVGNAIAESSGTPPRWMTLQRSPVPCARCRAIASIEGRDARLRLYAMSDTVVESIPMTWLRSRTHRSLENGSAGIGTTTTTKKRNNKRSASRVVVKWIKSEAGIPVELIREAFAYGRVGGSARFPRPLGLAHGRPVHARDHPEPDAGAGAGADVDAPARADGDDVADERSEDDSAAKSESSESAAHDAPVTAFALKGAPLGLMLESALGDLQHYMSCPAFRRAVDGDAAPLPTEALLAEMLLAAEELHAAGVHHRDIKPRNVLLMRTEGRPRATKPHPHDGDGAHANGDADASACADASPHGRRWRPVLADLGSSAPQRAPGARRTTGTCTRLYAPPEDEDDGCRGPAFDVYCIGALGWHYALLPEEPRIHVVHSVLDLGCNELGSLPSALRDLLWRMTSCYPHSRPSLRAALRHPALRAFVRPDERVDPGRLADAGSVAFPHASGRPRPAPIKDARAEAIVERLPGVGRRRFDILCGWMAEVCEFWGHSPVTHASSVLLLLDFLARVATADTAETARTAVDASRSKRVGLGGPQPRDLQAIGCACLMLATKLLETEPRPVRRFVKFSRHGFTERRLLAIEHAVFVSVDGLVPLVTDADARVLHSCPWWRVKDYWERADTWATRVDHSG